MEPPTEKQRTHVKVVVGGGGKMYNINNRE